MNKSLKKTAVFLTAAAIILSQTGLALAVCTLNGQEIPCDELVNRAKTPAAIMLVLLAVSIVFGIISFVFWLLMLIHAISKNIENKALWIIVVVLFGFIGSLVYYFAVKKDFKESENKLP